ncbi:MAG: hypothetical protein V3T83_16715 [Acidobacteriota bacterium]
MAVRTPSATGGVALLAAAFCILPAAAQRSISATANSYYESRESVFDFDKVDLSALYEEGRKRNPELAPKAVEWMIRRNLHFVFFNKINLGHFLVKPTPRQVVRKVEKIVTLHSQLDSLLQQGRRMAADPSEKKARRKLVRKIGDCARSIQKTFNEYFADYSSAPFLLKCCPSGSADARFGYFLLQSEQIHRLLDQEVERYFFESALSVVDVSDYLDRHSVATLSSSLHRLSRMTLKRSQE